jgi:excisionase family DNA binding protein
MQENVNEFYTSEDLLKRWDITANTLYAWLKRSDIPKWRVRRQYRFDKNEIHLWERKQASSLSERTGWSGAMPCSPRI